MGSSLTGGVAGGDRAAAPLQEKRISPSSEDEYVVVPSTSGKHQVQHQKQKEGGDNVSKSL